MQKKILTIIGVLVLLAAAYFFYRSFHRKESLPNPYEHSEIIAVTIEGEEGFGYDIFVDGRPYIHQTNIPAVGGTAGFKSESDAQAAAELVISKIRQGILPPTVSIEELQALGVI